MPAFADVRTVCVRRLATFHHVEVTEARLDEGHNELGWGMIFGMRKCVCGLFSVAIAS